MPLVKISIRNCWSKEEKLQLNDLIHKALVDALGIEQWDRFHRIHEFSQDDFVFPDSKSERFMIIEIHLYPGRSDTQKARMYQLICESLSTIGIAKTDVFVQVIEQPWTNWGIAGEPKKP